ncbi:MAG: prephenate dehydrogenase/arogenate dehydrogenase family protein [Clostridiales bacterium]|nr:prephenate dehydrogenase/arogenate dehydrogenase family protein [Clostridiales bacterium]
MIEEAKPVGIRKAGIVGLGLIGGSLAKAIRQRTDVQEIVGIDPDPKAGELAGKEGTITEFSTDDLSILEGCDLVILCAPIDAITKMEPELAALNIGVITDVGSVKRPVMKSICLPNFIGGHPMAGSERHGYACSSGSLFENALYVLCLPEDSSIPVQKLMGLEALIRKIGAIPMYMTAEEHDMRVAAVSHLPHIVASSLSLLLAEKDDGALGRMAAGGFRDITRIASSDPKLWAGITENSKETLLPVLDDYIDLLSRWRNTIAADNESGLEKLFTQGACYRDHLDSNMRGALEASAGLTVYVDDKPGELARITAILGKGNINIRNINIRNFRTYEGGQVSLLLGTAKEVVEAYALLREAGYECD